ncbi:hypothetical protein MWU59_13850 [Flavobacteriaceae bacterium F08102]|nr:hypothetical protein [Flavobacteriaceae bacterium F08102]
MKTHYLHLLLVLLLLSSPCFAQTKEQQKMIDKALKMRDSIMQSAEMKALIEQANEQQAIIELNKSTSSNKTAPTPKIPHQNNAEKYTLMSDTNRKLIGWNNGEADLIFNYHYDMRNDQIHYVLVGKILANGTIKLNPTATVPILKPLHNFKNSNNFYDIHDTNSYQYENKEAGFKLNSYLLVYQNNQKIGMLTAGNSAKVTRNLLTPGNLYFGDEGYLISWVYVDKACAIKAQENWKGDLSNTGVPLIVETNVSYSLFLNPGWNLVKTDVIGKYDFPSKPIEDRSRYKKHLHTSISKLPEEVTFYFRK